MTPDDFARIAQRIADRIERDGNVYHLSSGAEEIRLGWLEWKDRNTIKPIEWPPGYAEMMKLIEARETAMKQLYQPDVVISGGTAPIAITSVMFPSE